MSRALPTSKMSRTAGRRATIGAKPAGKAHRRRLACERLEDRRLLNGVTRSRMDSSFSLATWNL